MSPVYFDKNGRPEWYPKTGREENLNVNLGHRDSEQAFTNSLIGVARMMEMETRGIVTQDDVEKCLGHNCEKLKMDREELVQRALDILQNPNEEI